MTEAIDRGSLAGIQLARKEAGQRARAALQGLITRRSRNDDIGEGSAGRGRKKFKRSHISLPKRHQPRREWI